MPSETDICNDALDNIGHSLVIASLTEDSDEAAACQRHYARTRDQLLRDFAWPFATRRVTPAALVAATLAGGAVPSPWCFAYAYPDGMLSLRKIIWLPTGSASPCWWWWPGCGWDRSYRYAWEMLENIPHTIESDATLDAKIILTDAGDSTGNGPTIIGTFQITNSEQFPEDFSEALGFKLAAKLALTIRKDPKTAQAMIAAYQVVFDKAVANAKNETGPTYLPPAQHILARR